MKHFYVLFALLSFAFTVRLSAQNVAGSVEVGVYSAYQFTQFSDGTMGYTGEYDEGAYKSFGYTLGGLVEYRISHVLSVIGIIRFENVHVENSLQDQKFDHYRQDKSYILYSYDLTAPQTSITILVKRRIGKSKFSISGGGSIGFLFAGKQEERLYIKGSDLKFPDIDSIASLPGVKGYTPHFSDESRTSITLYKGEIYQRTALQLGLTAGLQYDLPIHTLDEATQKFVTLTPSVLFNYNLTTYSDYEKLRAWNVSVGFALKVGL